MHFQAKNNLKSNRYHNVKQAIIYVNKLIHRQPTLTKTLYLFIYIPGHCFGKYICDQCYNLELKSVY
jgi:hypothetical protein